MTSYGSRYGASLFYRKEMREKTRDGTRRDNESLEGDMGQGGIMNH